MSIELKIKEKHLALEPHIIRCEERKLKARIKYMKKNSLEKTDILSSQLNSLNLHRRGEVRNAARATHLARTYLAGSPYILAEKKRKKDKEPMFQYLIIPKITSMVKKYGTNMASIEDKAIRDWSVLKE